MTGRWPWVAASVLALALAPEARAQGTEEPLAGLGALLTACAAGETCALVETLPCGCAAGGGHLAVNGQYAELWAQIGRYLASRPPAVMCAQMYRCNEQARAVCRQGRCRVETR